MTAEEQLQTFRMHVRDALEKIPGSRLYALTETSLDALALLGIAWQEERAGRDEKFSVRAFSDVIAELVALTPSLQRARADTPPPLPEVWRDSCTNQVARNPWSEPIRRPSRARYGQRLREVFSTVPLVEGFFHSTPL
jgi:hypothetical protein